MLEARGLTKRYGAMLALDRVSFQLRRGEIVGYLGPNGSGKSTTVNIVVGLLEPTSGSVALDGRPLSDNPAGYKRRLGYVPEEPYLYTHLSAILGRALRHLTLIDWDAHPRGRHLLDGEDIVAIVSEYETRHSNAVPWEAHRRYIDIQYMHAGLERIGLAPLSTLDVGAYDPARDLVRATGEGGYITLPAGSFAILWPDEAHRPGIAVDEPRQVKKIVLKVSAGDDD